MLESIIVTFSVLMIVFSASMIWKIMGKSLVITPILIYFGIYLLYHYPLYFFLEYPNSEYLLVLSLGLFAFTIGALLPMNKKNPKKDRVLQLDNIISNIHPRTFFFLLGVIILTAFLYFQGPPPTFGIFSDLLTGHDVTNSLLEMSGFRRDLTKSHYFGGEYRGQGIFKLIHEIGWQLIIVMSFLSAILKKQRNTWVFFTFIFIFGVVSLFGTGVKGPVGWVLITMLIVFTQVYRLKLNKLFYFILGFISLLFILMALQPSRYEGDTASFSVVGDAIVHRLFMGNGLNTYELVTRIISGEIPFQYGYEHLTVFMNSLPGIQFDKPFANDLFFILNPDMSDTHTTYATYTYLGTMFLDFGYAGVIFISFITGFTLQYSYKIILKWKPSIISISFGAVLIQKLGIVVTGNILSLGPTVVVLSFFYILINKISKKQGSIAL